MSEVLSVVEKLPQRVANEDAVRVLTDLLERAKSGEIIGIAVVSQRPNYDIVTDISGGAHVAMLLGGATYLVARLTKQMGPT